MFVHICCLEFTLHTEWLWNIMELFTEGIMELLNLNVSKSKERTVNKHSLPH